MKDFFISYTDADRPWAEWIAWVLEENGYSVELSVWQPGDTVVQVWERSADFDRGMALLSKNYLKLVNDVPEEDVLDDLHRLIREGKLIPVRVEECRLTGWLEPIVYLDLVGSSEPEAEQAIEMAAEPVEEIPKIEGSIEGLLPTVDGAVNEILETDLETLKLHRRSHTVQFFLEPLTNDLGIEMMLIPERTFVMGSPEDELDRTDAEGPQHEVSVSTFFMSKYPVTQAQWRFVAGLPQVNRELDPDPSHFKGDKRPVEQVSWYDAVEFCDRLSAHTGRDYRLHSEAEWEYDCRASGFRAGVSKIGEPIGGVITPFHFGETITTDLANYQGTDNEEYKWSGSYGRGPKGEYREETTPVDHFGIANAFGLCDMHGNVWEWCQDHWHNNYEGAPTDGSAWLTDNENASRLVRGGSWFYSPGNCRSAYRDSFSPGLRDFDLGFRVVCRAPRTL